MLARIATATLHGVEARPVWVEVSLTTGLPAFTVVGLPEGAVREGRERVLAALRHSGVRLPPRRITVNLAPADLRKEGTGFDLPVAVALLAGAELVPLSATQGWGFIGELGLDGTLRPVRGALALADGCRAAGVRRVVVPPGNVREVAALPGVEVWAPASLDQLIDTLRSGDDRAVCASVEVPEGAAEPCATQGDVARGPDLSEVRGQAMARRAMEIAAAGGHNLLLEGPPGTGKTLLARRLPGLLPPLSFDEALEVTRIHSVAGRASTGQGLIWQRPFRAPHHTVSMAGLVGGGSPPRPGEVSLAHRGVLFLDEMPEFSRSTLEVLRQPLEDGSVALARARSQVVFPAEFMLVGAMNPCPCGHLGDGSNRCTCDPGLVARYRARLSGPLLDRIDLHVRVARLSAHELHDPEPGEGTVSVATRVLAANRWRSERQGRRNNAALTPGEVEASALLTSSGRQFLVDAAERLELSARGFHRVLRVARTIADLGLRERVNPDDLAEALCYRSGTPSPGAP